MSNRDHGVLRPGVEIRLQYAEVPKGVAVEAEFVDPAGVLWHRVGDESRLMRRNVG
jgi:hypothetical protein